MKIIGIYKITNTVTGDFYIGSSKNIKQRLAVHKCQSTWKNNSNNPMYQDMQKYGVDKFEFEIIAEVEPDSLKEAEQQFIEMLKPTYNDRNAYDLDVERYKEWHKERYNKYKEEILEQRKQYRESHKEQRKQYNNQQCSYNGKHITLSALATRFRRKGIPNPTKEAKKYLVFQSKSLTIKINNDMILSSDNFIVIL